MIRIAPSILSADFAYLADEVRLVEAAGADLIHVDVMDGHFVPNLTIGPVVVKALRSVTALPLDVHLMIERPERFLEDFAAAGADRITVHAEACVHLHRVVQAIRALGKKPGVALNPHTPLVQIEEIVGHIDLVLVMSVNPGFGGQTFIPESVGKLQRLREMLAAHHATGVHIEVDGGIKYENAAEVAAAGAQILVSGSGIFGTPDPAATVRKMKRLFETGD